MAAGSTIDVGFEAGSSLDLKTDSMEMTGNPRRV